MMHRFLFALLTLSLASCGVQRPLIKPSEIPAYEKSQREKREKYEQEQRELEQQVREREAQEGAE